MEKEPKELSPREKLLLELRHLRDDYSDEIPEQVINSVTGQEYKVRNAWFGFVAGHLELGEINGLISEELAEKARQFGDKYCTDEFRDRLTTSEDIEEANALLNEAIDELE
jgi:hypothetical protein